MLPLNNLRRVGFVAVIFQLIFNVYLIKFVSGFSGKFYSYHFNH